MSNRVLVLVTAVAVLWGIPYLFIAVALEELSPAVIAFARTGLAAVILLPLALAAGALAGLRERWAWLVVLAATQMAGPFVLLGFAEERISSSLTGILVSATPLLVALVALGVDRSESASGSRLVGLGVGLAGVAILLGLDVGRDAGALVGALAALGTALGYAISALLLNARFTGCDGRGVVGATTAVAAVLLLPAALGTFPGAAPSGDALGSLVVLGIASTAGGFLLFFRLQAEIGPGRASVVAYLAPGVAVVLGVAFLDDPFGPATVAGLGLILLGSFLAGRRAGARLRLRPAGSTSAP